MSLRWTTALALLLAPVAGCTGGPGPSGPTFEGHDLAPEIVDSFADDVVVPTYSLLATRLAALRDACQTLASEATAPNLETAQQAWIDARAPWESSEGFLFGPVDAFGFDPALDSWPVDQAALDGVLASSDPLSQEYVSSLDDTLQGFHTAEYLLFGASANKTVQEFTVRELDYLVAVTSEMAGLSADLAAAWTTGLDGNPPYQDIFKDAGNAANPAYPSLGSAAQEMLYGMIGILDEVANGKIADPFTQQDSTLVESQFSFNSLTDFTNNIHSVRNAYLGRNLDTGATGTSISDFVLDVDSELDARIQSELDASIAALDAIERPFRDSITNPDASDDIRSAQDAIRQTKQTMESELLPFVTR